MSESSLTLPLMVAVFLAAMSQFLVGYSTGVMNAPEAVVFPGHTTAAWSWAVAAFAVGGPVGALIAGDLADTRGRRGALIINTWTFLLGGLLQTFAPNLLVITASRLIIGYASGTSSVLVPIYLREISPDNLRGTFGTLTQFALVIGILISNLMAFPFATETGWRMLFAVTSIVALLQLLCAPFLVESPRWLLQSDISSVEARDILKKLRGSDEGIEMEVTNMTASARENSGDQKVTYMELFSDASVRPLLVASLVLQMGQQLSGINAVFYYSTSFFEGVIDDPLIGTTLVGAVNVLATYFALLIMDSVGRRTLILWSSGGMFLCCVVIMMSLLHYFDNLVALGAVNVYVTFFEIGLGPVPWLIVAEMFDARYVATAQSVCSQLNWICNFVVGLVFPYLNKYMGPYSFFPFSTILLAVFLFSLFSLPETKGMTPQEIQQALVLKDSSAEERQKLKAKGETYSTV